LLNFKQMEIQYLGGSSFRVKTKKAILVTDPFKKTVADIVIVSRRNEEKINPALIKGTTNRPFPFVLPGPGEYEISEVSILGREWKESLVYIIQAEDMRIAFLGDFQGKLKDEQLEELNGVDILLVSPKAIEVVNQIEPRVVIPATENPEDFLKNLGVEKILPLPKLVVNNQNLPEEREVVVLNARD